MRHQRRCTPRTAAAALGAAVLASGCFGAAEATAAGLASQSPAQVAAAVKAAISHAKGYELQFDLHKASGATESGTIESHHGNLFIKGSLKPRQVFQLIVLGERAYFKASTPFWISQGVGKSLARVLAPKWYKYPHAEAARLAKGLGDVSPSTFAKCLGPQDESSNATVSTGKFNGRPVVLFKDPGTQPGSAPGTMAIAATGPAYPLHIAITGPTKPGGPKGACGSGSGDKTTGTLTMSHWGDPPTIKAPAGAIKLPSN